MNDKIKAKIVSIEKGLQEYDEIEMIRVKSNHHNLLIMKNYMPLIGELKGSVEFVFEDHTIRFRDLQGYYMHKKNEFSLIIREGEPDPVQISEEEEYAE